MTPCPSFLVKQYLVPCPNECSFNKNSVYFIVSTKLPRFRPPAALQTQAINEHENGHDVPLLHSLVLVGSNRDPCNGISVNTSTDGCSCACSYI